MTTKTAFNDQAQLPLLQEAQLVKPIKTGAKLPSYIADHRKRLRERFEQGGPEAMPDYELVELFLFHVLPRVDTKPIAHALLKKFGNLAGVTAAPEHELTLINGVGPAVAREIRVLAAIAPRITRSEILNREAVSSWDAVVNYCRAAMANRHDEQFRVLFLDKKNCIIADELLGQGTVDHVPVYPREVVKRALELSSSALILVHNHPSGDPTPSPEDIIMTQRIHDVCDALSITLHDHIIVCANGETSFRSDGLL